MSRIDRNYSVRRAFAAAVLAVAVVVTGATMSVEARSITGVRHLTPRDGVSSLAVTFEVGEPGDEHALYIAYDTEDKGADISNWAALQRGCNVAADATSATIPVSPLLTGAGYTVCRVFLTTFRDDSRLAAFDWRGLYGLPRVPHDLGGALRHVDRVVAPDRHAVYRHRHQAERNLRCRDGHEIRFQCYAAATFLRHQFW